MKGEENTEAWRKSQDLKALPQAERCVLVVNTGVTPYKHENYEALLEIQKRTKP
jgi:hypothetical protein